MSETFSRHRGLESRGREPGAGPAEKSDPLAELARLVGREDPFRDLFPGRERTTQSSPTKPASAERRTSAMQDFDYSSTEHDLADDASAGTVSSHETGGYANHEVEDDAFHAPLGHAPRDSFRLPAMPSRNDQFGIDAQDDEFAAVHGQAPELNADLWAQGMAEPVSAEPLHFAHDEDEADTGAQGSQRRTLVVLLAVIALTVGGLGATFLVSGGNASRTAEGDVPTIMADTAPTKVQPPDTSNQSTGGDGNTALIEKSASDNVANAKVVNTQEQPVDLSQLPQAPPAATQKPAIQPASQPDDGRIATATIPAGSNPSPFPEPHRVKTILIRPDGSVVGEDQPPPVAAAPQPSPAAPVARPATPKATARVSSTPKATATPAEGAAPVKPKVPHAQAKPATETAAADTPADTTASTTPSTGGGGSFAVQLAAPGSEQEAKEISARLLKRFSSELDGHAPSIRKADKGDKSVYRVRVSNLSQDDARALCTKLQAGGGTCFVVRN